MPRNSIEYELDRDPTNNDNYSAGFSFLDEWTNTLTGDQFACYGDGLWKKLNATPVFNTLSVREEFDGGDYVIHKIKYLGRNLFPVDEIYADVKGRRLSSNNPAKIVFKKGSTKLFERIISNTNRQVLKFTKISDMPTEPCVLTLKVHVPDGGWFNQSSLTIFNITMIGGM